MRHTWVAVLVLVCSLAPGLLQEEELAAFEAAAAESPATPAEIHCPAKVNLLSDEPFGRGDSHQPICRQTSALCTTSQVSQLQEHGAVGDGETYDTAAIQAAVDECAQHPEGGVVTFEENTRYLSAQVVMKSGVRLRIPKSTTLLAGLKVAPSQHPLLKPASEACNTSKLPCKTYLQGSPGTTLCKLTVACKSGLHATTRGVVLCRLVFAGPLAIL